MSCFEIFFVCFFRCKMIQICAGIQVHAINPGHNVLLTPPTEFEWNNKMHIIGFKQHVSGHPSLCQLLHGRLRCLKILEKWCLLTWLIYLYRPQKNHWIILLLMISFFELLLQICIKTGQNNTKKGSRVLICKKSLPIDQKSCNFDQQAIFLLVF